MRIAISLIWLKIGKVGGVESFTRNLLDGFACSLTKNDFLLLCSKDNYDSFKHYSQDERFKLFICPTESQAIVKTLFYENFFLDDFVSKLNVDFCFVPCYRMPLLSRNNKYVVVVHDLISYHYPHYFSSLRRYWLNWGYKIASKKSYKTVAISDFVRNDIINRFNLAEDHVARIYNPILPSVDYVCFDSAKEAFNIEKDQYFYTVSSMLPHKNLLVLLRVMHLLKQYSRYSHFKLVISGVNQSTNSDFYAEVSRLGIQDSCVLTGFVSNAMRNTLIKNCCFFLFPSLFEGFGMPPVEALEIGARVITTKCASIPEVTNGFAFYIDEPFNENQWLEAINRNITSKKTIISFQQYNVSNIINSYLVLFSQIVSPITV